MIDVNNIRFNLYPGGDISLGIRDLMYERGQYTDCDTEEKLEILLDWFVTHGNRCFIMGQTLSDRSE